MEGFSPMVLQVTKEETKQNKNYKMEQN